MKTFAILFCALTCACTPAAAPKPDASDGAPAPASLSSYDVACDALFQAGCAAGKQPNCAATLADMVDAGYFTITPKTVSCLAGAKSSADVVACPGWSGGC